MRKKLKGFTLIEMLVVIAIIAMLVVFVAPWFFGKLTQAKRDLIIPRMKIVEAALENYAINCGGYPDDLDALLKSPEDLEDKWRGPYLKKKELLDPWDNPFVYEPSEESSSGVYVLISYGADGRPGGEGENEDIDNIEQ